MFLRERQREGGTDRRMVERERERERKAGRFIGRRRERGSE